MTSYDFVLYFNFQHIQYFNNIFNIFLNVKIVAFSKIVLLNAVIHEHVVVQQYKSPSNRYSCIQL